MNIGYGYCGDLLESHGIVYLQGKSGNLSNMDIDCDGVLKGVGDDGRCKSSDDTQYQTSFKDIASEYSNGVEDLNAFVHDYVVFGNYGEADGYITYDPEEDGIQPLSVMAVICNNQLVSSCISIISSFRVVTTNASCPVLRCLG